MSTDPVRQLLDDLDTAKRLGDNNRRIGILGQLLSRVRQRRSQIGGAEIVLGEIELLRQLGNAFQDIGNLQEAHNYRLTAIRQAQALGASCSQETKLLLENDIGRSFIEGYEYEKAEAHLKRAIEIAQSLGPEYRNQLIIAKMNLDLIYAKTGDVEQAIRMIEQLIPEATELQDQYTLALLHINLSDLFCHSQLDMQKAMNHAQLALVNADLSLNASIQMQAHFMYGQSHKLAQVVSGNELDAKTTISHLQQARAMAQRLGNKKWEAHVEQEWGQICQIEDQKSDALQHYERSLYLYNETHSQLGFEAFILGALQSEQSVFYKTTELLLQLRQPLQAFQQTETLRNRLLLMLLGDRKRADSLRRVADDPVLIAALNTYGIEALKACFGDGTRGKVRGVTVGDNLQGDAQQAVLRDSLAMRNARQQFLKQHESHTLGQAMWQPRDTPLISGLDQVQRLLTTNEALLSYFVTEKSVIVFVVTSDNHHFQQLSYSQARLADDINEFCSAMDDLQSIIYSDPLASQLWRERKTEDPIPRTIDNALARTQRISEKLFALLIVPILAVIHQKLHLIIVPHGPLHRLPWSVLRYGNQYLVERYSISLLPSASIGSALVANQPNPSNYVVFYGDPDPDNENLRLPFSQQEVKACYQVFNVGPEPFIGNAATKQNFLEHAPNAAVIHLACHHIFDAESPILSFLKLAGNNGSDFLYVSDVDSIKLSAELVTLSACASARGSRTGGDEQIGMIRAFLVAGARSVISTLWPIEDASASVFFANLYQQMVQVNLASSLANVQRLMIKDAVYQLPCFWAPYILSGVWNKSLTIQRRIN